MPWAAFVLQQQGGVGREGKGICTLATAGCRRFESVPPRVTPIVCFLFVGGAVTQHPKVNAALPGQAPADVLGLHGLLACERGRHEGAVGGQGDAVALQPRLQPLLQKLPLQAQVQRPQGQRQEVQPETHQDAGVAIPAGRRAALGGRDALPGVPGSAGVHPGPFAPTGAPTHLYPSTVQPTQLASSSVFQKLRANCNGNTAAELGLRRGPTSPAETCPGRGAGGGAETHPRPGPTHTASPQAV